MKWNNYLLFGPLSVFERKTIQVRQLGLPKVVVVRTKNNGGL